MEGVLNVTHLDIMAAIVQDNLELRCVQKKKKLIKSNVFGTDQGPRT